MKDIKLLLVDDEADFIKTLAERLDLRDLSSNIALGGDQAIQELDDSEPDVMVLDLRMPGIDGMEVLRQVRSNYPDVQVIIQTGQGSRQEEEEARALGIFAFLKKPVPIEELVICIQAAAHAKQTVNA
jgi:DNA-binding NtrC family response regulator